MIKLCPNCDGEPITIGDGPRACRCYPCDIQASFETWQKFPRRSDLASQPQSGLRRIVVDNNEHLGAVTASIEGFTPCIAETACEAVGELVMDNAATLNIEIVRK